MSRPLALTEEQAVEAYKRYLRGARVTTLAKELGVTKHTIYNHFRKVISSGKCVQFT